MLPPSSRGPPLATAHVARFADGAGMLFVDELQLMAPPCEGSAAAPRAPAAADAAPA